MGNSSLLLVLFITCCFKCSNASNATLLNNLFYLSQSSVIKDTDKRRNKRPFFPPLLRIYLKLTCFSSALI